MEENDVRKDWFMQQHFTTEQLQQIYEWEQKSGKIADVVKGENEFMLFHIEDTKHTIELCFQKEEYMLRRWCERLGYKTKDGISSKEFDELHGKTDPPPIPRKEIFREKAISITLSDDKKFHIVSGDYALVAKRTASNAYEILMLDKEEYAKHLKETTGQIL